MATGRGMLARVNGVPQETFRECVFLNTRFPGSSRDDSATQTDSVRPLLSPAGTRPSPFALFAALTVHIAVAASLLWDISDRGAEAEGQGGITMAFEISGAVAGAVVETSGKKEDSDAGQSDPARSPEKSEEVVEATAPKDEMVPVEEQAAAPVLQPVSEREAGPEGVPETPENTLTEEVPEPETVKQDEAEPVIEAVESPTKPAPPKPPEEVSALRLSRHPDPPDRKPMVPEMKREVVAELAQETKGGKATKKSAAAAVAGAGGQAERSEAEGKGSGTSAAGGGLVGASADYFAMLRAWLEQHKEYPRRARIRREQGTVLLRVAFVPGGDLLTYSVQRSSGHPELDRAAEAMLKRAQPFPPNPTGARETLEVMVPVSFLLQ